MFVATCALLLAGVLSAPSAESGLAGVVRDAKDQPIAGAWIEARRTEHGALTAADFEGAPGRSARSDAKGLWALPGLDAGAWIVTAVASTTPRTDDEMQQLARPGAEHGAPDGVAVTRFLREFPAQAGRRTEMVSIGLALGSTTDHPLHGRLTGTFAPDRCAYEVRLSPSSEAPAESGTTVTETSYDMNDPAGAPTEFRVVPDADGRFDFGALDVSPYDSIEVVAFTLDRTDAQVTLRQFFGAPVEFERWQEGLEIPLVSERVVTLRAVEPDGRTLLDLRPGEKVEFVLWGEQLAGISFWTDKAEVEERLKPGTYLVRVAQGRGASALTAFTLTAEGPADISLVPKTCPDFTVHLVDQHGAPLASTLVKLGVETGAAFPKPCRVRATCEYGVLDLKQVLPGSYLVEFGSPAEDPYTVPLDLKPGDEPIVVNVP